MTATKPAFKTLDFQKLQSVVEEYAAEKNVPALAFPAEISAAAVAASVDPVPLEPAKVRPKRASKTAQPAPVRRLAVELPDYLFTAISKKAAEEGTTKRYVILEALRAAGFVVNEIDFNEDGRRVQ